MPTAPVVSRRGRAAIGLTALVASLVAAGPASAAPNGTVTVSGGSQSRLELTLSDVDAQFGTNLTPDGVASNGEATAANVDAGSPSAGACYEWPGSATVRSNVNYDVTVSAAAANNRLDLLTANPASYGACTTGEQAATAMYTGATPPGAWVTAQTGTTGRAHAFWLGLDVRWADAPSATLGAATLTLTASAAS
jgi:hypothetical protein